MRRKYYRLMIRVWLASLFLTAGLMGPASATAAAPAPQPVESVYTVQPSDTLGSIAARFRISVVSLLDANPGITNPRQIAAGKQITIPAAGLRPGQSIWDGYSQWVPGTPAPTQTPSPTPPPPGMPGPTVEGTAQPIGAAGSWNMIFEDEFDGGTLDTTHWNTAFPWGRTSTTTPQLIYRPESVSVSDGTVQLVAQRGYYLGYPYTSGIITTNGKFSFKYGMVEFRAQVPAGQGLWPAFWCLPASGASRPEIDVMEILGSRPTSTEMHYHDQFGDASGTAYSGTDFSAGWHTFAVDWEPDAITWYVDGVVQNQFTDKAVIAAQPMYLIANLQVGGWPGSPDSTTPFPATYAIDYVRVWQH